MTEKRVITCPKCGSLDISSFKHQGYWLRKDGPIMGVYACQKCGHEGLPLELDSLKDHKKFLKLKQKNKHHKNKN